MERVILIADDAVMNRVLVRSVLNSKLPSAVILEAENGLEVLELVRSREVHLIILDLVMPHMDGYQTLVELKKDERYKDIPVIVNSSISEIQSIERTLKDGAIDYFIKPLSPDEMQIILPLKAKNALIYYEQNKTIHDLNRRINDELKNANAFAKYILPKPGKFDELDLYIKYQPSMGIGGDFFDCVKENDRIWFMIADVTGHGIAAGMAASMLKILFRTTVERPDLTPSAVLEHINREIFQIFDRGEKMSYIAFTAFLGCVHQHRLTYSNAAQPYPWSSRRTRAAWISASRTARPWAFWRGSASAIPSCSCTRGRPVPLHRRPLLRQQERRLQELGEGTGAQPGFHPRHGPAPGDLPAEDQRLLPGGPPGRARQSHRRRGHGADQDQITAQTSENRGSFSKESL